uniref:Uncharacterized protein n=1 Tax=Sphaerulina musiva TaxID=85929 RepID=A0A120GVZ2_9PEZI|nr:hypothetical protein [Sphaerulina musiva]
MTYTLRCGRGRTSLSVADGHSAIYLKIIFLQLFLSKRSGTVLSNCGAIKRSVSRETISIGQFAGGIFGILARGISGTCGHTPQTWKRQLVSSGHGYFGHTPHDLRIVPAVLATSPEPLR